MRRLLAAVWAAIWKVAKWPMAAAVVVLLLLLMPVAYVEIACRGEPGTQTYRSAIADPAFQRREANTYLTYPEWHIVYAYDGLAEALKTGDEHAFDYIRSVSAFWRSTCALMRVADAHGGADGNTRAMIHTIGVSFTTEMGVKGAYEETIGRAAAWLRGRDKTPQDTFVSEMAVDYAAFLRQTPWYKYPFGRKARELWAAPVDGVVRGWERRLGLGLEFTAKAAYAKVLAGAAANAPAQLVIRSIVAGLDEKTLSSIPGVHVIGARPGGVEIETPRYDLFTSILVDIARRGGTISEIAGNDDIMVSVTIPEGSDSRLQQGTVIMRLKRDGFRSERLLVDMKVSGLAAFLNAHPLGDPGLEHVFDY
ncbi:MAG TPA: hypothetical protein VI485_30040 [Vicinamibacterales bacterium]|nr:hypothetical protein [Vicinamibacterales bacterium]